MSQGRELYTTAIDFKGPAYLPVYIEVHLPAFYEQDAEKCARIRELRARIPDDILNLSPNHPFLEGPATVDGVTRWKDHWGTGWSEDGLGAKTSSHPLESGYHLLESLQFPDPDRPRLFATAEEKIARADGQYIVGSVWFTLFERLWMLRGFDNMLIDPYVNHDEFAALRDRIVDYNLAMIDHWARLGANGVFFSDDWGSQRGLLVAPEDWRTFYKEAYARMFSRVRDAGLHVWMHLCGDITAILPDLIELGLNVLNPVQPQAMSIDALGRDFGGKVCFFGGADVQGTLVKGSPEDVKREVRHLVECLGSFKGGFIGSTSHGLMRETPLDNIIALLEAFTEYV